MRNTAPTSTFERQNPLLGIEDDYLINVYGDYTVGFKVKLPENLTLTEGDFDLMHGTWVKALRTLPPFSVFHKMDVYEQKRYTPDIRVENPSMLTKAHELHFNERPYLSHTCYLFLSKTSKNNAKKKTLLTTLCRGRIVPVEQLDGKICENFKEAVQQFKAILEATGHIEMTQLTEKDYMGDGEVEGLLDRYAGLFGQGRQLTDLELRPDRVIAGEREACVFTLADVDNLPMIVAPNRLDSHLSTDKTQCHMSSVAPICQNLGHSHIFNQYVFIDEVKPMLDQLEQRGKHMMSLSKLSRENMVNAENINDFIQLVHEQNLYPVRTHFNIIAWGEASEFDRIRSDIAAALSVIDCTPRQCTVDAPVFFWSAIPGNGADFPSEETFIAFAENVACLFNEETNYASSDSSFGIKLCDRFLHIPLHVDISDEPMRKNITTNRNKFILGPSGSGKSYFTNHMVRQYWEQGTHIILVDVGHSYSSLCDLIHQRTGGEDGIYYTYTEDKPIAFNPFYNEERVFGLEQKESIVALLLTLWKKEGEVSGRSEDITIGNMVRDYTDLIAKDPDAKPSFNTFYEWVRDVYAPYLKNEKKVSAKQFDMDSFLYVLEPYYKGGQYDYLLNSEENIDLLNKRFVVFELDNIKDNEILFPVVTIIIMDTFITKMRKLTGIRKMILIEEAWKAISKGDMAYFIKYLFKTVRKHFGEAVVVTQEADDILDSPIVKKSIIDNSDCKILLDQRKYMNKFEEIQAVLGLTDKQKAQVLSINQNLDPNLPKYKEVYIDLGGSHSCVYATEVSDEENLIYTTEQREKMKVQEKAREYGGNMALAIKDLAEKKRNQE